MTGGAAEGKKSGCSKTLVTMHRVVAFTFLVRAKKRSKEDFGELQVANLLWHREFPFQVDRNARLTCIFYSRILMCDFLHGQAGGEIVSPRS